MKFFGPHRVFLAVVLPAAIGVFFGSYNTAFASLEKQANWVTPTTLSRPGIPRILKGENSLTPTWVWDSSNSQISGRIYYSVQWCQNAGFSGCAANLMYTDSTSFSFDSSNQLVNGTWYMRVRAVNEYGGKSAYSLVGSGTLRYYLLATPHTFNVNLVGSEAKLEWGGCSAGGFRIWASDTGLAGSYKPIGETESHGFSSNLGSNPARWFYVTAIDKLGNESSPSPAIRVQIPGLEQAEKPGLGADLVAIIEPIWRGFSFSEGKVAGDRVDKAIADSSSFNLSDFVPVDYFRTKSD